MLSGGVHAAAADARPPPGITLPQAGSRQRLLVADFGFKFSPCQLERVAWASYLTALDLLTCLENKD